MKKLVATALTLVFISALTTAMSAEEGTIVTRLDHDFVVAGATLPAGTYRFTRDIPGSQFFTIRSSDGHPAAFVLPMTFEAAARDRAHLTLLQIGGVTYLRQITTPRGVYTLVSPRATKPIGTNKCEAMSSAGTN